MSSNMMARFPALFKLTFTSCTPYLQCHALTSCLGGPVLSVSRAMSCPQKVFFQTYLADAIAAGLKLPDVLFNYNR